MFNKLRAKIKAKIAEKVEQKTATIIVNQISKSTAMNNFMQSIFGTSWRTAVTGYASAIFIVCWPIIENGNFDIHRDWKQLVMAAGAAIFGNVTKDAKVSGLPKSDKDNGSTTN